MTGYSPALELPEKPKTQSPFKVPVLSVVPALELDDVTPLMPYERDHLKLLLNQVNAAPQRVRDALIRGLQEQSSL